MRRKKIALSVIAGVLLITIVVVCLVVASESKQRAIASSRLIVSCVGYTNSTAGEQRVAVNLANHNELPLLVHHQGIVCEWQADGSTPFSIPGHCFLGAGQSFSFGVPPPARRGPCKLAVKIFHDPEGIHAQFVRIASRSSVVRAIVPASWWLNVPTYNLQAEWAPK